MRPRRALLYMPGNEMRKIRKATTLGVDCICMDLEDGVAANRKEDARWTIREALENLDFGRAERLTRINPIGSGLEVDDLKVVLPARPDGIVIPKVENSEQLQWASAQFKKIEKEQNWTDGSIRLIAIVETAMGILNLRQIANSDPRLVALIFGADDFAADIGATRTPQSSEVFYARSAVVTHAAAYGLQAIDIVFIDLNDLERLQHESQEGARMGFSGKQIIHPNQVDPVQAAFTPSREAIHNAQRLMAAYQQHTESGIGAFVIDGKMIDAPTIKIAERILNLASSIGIIEP